MAVTSADFWDRIAPKYSRQPIADPESYARKLAATQALMQPDMAVLELGCGTGSTALEHAERVQADLASVHIMLYLDRVSTDSTPADGMPRDGEKEARELG